MNKIETMTFSRKKAFFKRFFYATRKTLFAKSVAKTTRRYDILTYMHLSPQYSFSHADMRIHKCDDTSIYAQTSIRQNGRMRIYTYILPNKTKIRKATSCKSPRHKKTAHDFFVRDL